jgi:hypothetical protein
MGFEPTFPAIEQAKTALDSAATVIGKITIVLLQPSTQISNK